MYFKVHLESTDAKSCQFRILPKYKVNSEGENASTCFNFSEEKKHIKSYIN